jgi:type IV pilus assembly protein PilY1
MKPNTSSRFAPRNVLCLLAFCAGFALSLPAFSATVDLSKVPLANSTTTSVLPNLMFILDNSGSIEQDYTPDYINDI